MPGGSEINVAKYTASGQWNKHYSARRNDTFSETLVALSILLRLGYLKIIAIKGTFCIKVTKCARDT